jgi:hypothetical protein
VSRGIGSVDLGSRQKESEDMPTLTREQVRAALESGVAGAEELRKTLERSHLQGYSRAMSLRLR